MKQKITNLYHKVKQIIKKSDHLDSFIDTLSGKLLELANILLATFVIGQLVSNQKVKISLLLAGLFLFCSFYLAITLVIISINSQININR